ncbi:MAG: 4-hydroxy-tetrahydrodipicolinate reductase, partial [Gammaproteobacteria bacterium]|nr:4-hydroxy-tetrahydrodipicolinate reductase [Gammaproteobacteria bacterium]
MVKVAITGASGRMGRALIDAVQNTDGMSLAAAIVRPGSSVIGADAGEVVGVGRLDVSIVDDLEKV